MRARAELRPRERHTMTNPASTGSAQIHVQASAEQVFAYLTNLDLLPTLSPENVRCELREGDDELIIGARFRGWNEAPGKQWHADCVVTALEPSRLFEYKVPPKYEHATTWSYLVEADADGQGCTVTESFDAPLLLLPEVYPGKIEGRRDNLEAACETTLANLKAAIEN